MQNGAGKGEVPNCPKCGASMRMRQARRGPYRGNYFYGCSRYPVCYEIVNIDQGRAARKKETEARATVEAEVAAEERKRKKHTEGTSLTERQTRQIQILRDRFLNITASNRSIKLNKLYDKWAFDLSILNTFGKDETNEVLESALRREKEIRLAPIILEDQEQQKISRKLTSLYRNISEIEKEKGLYDLNIGFPFMRGLTLEGKVIQAPILLVPVRLSKTSPKRGPIYWQLKQDTDQPISFNKILLMGLAKYNKVQVNEEIYDVEILDELYGKQNFIKWLAETLETFGLKCGIDAEAFDDEIDPLPEFTMKDVPLDLEPGKLRVHQCAVLGHFPQYSSSILNDYIHFLESSQEELEGVMPFLETDFLEEENEAPKVSSDYTSSGEPKDSETRTVDHRDERDNIFLLPSDSSQDRILISLSEEATRGLVVWGPPGTGKSQTIVNMIGDSLAKGKTVLVVCQKRAALDVVYDRLDTLGLSPFVCVVHHSRQDRKDLYRKLDSTLELLSGHEENPESFEALSDRIGEHTKKLNGVFHTLSKDNGSGWSLYDIYTDKRADVPTSIRISEWFRSLSMDALEKSAQKLSILQRRLREVGYENPWKIRKSFSGYGPQEKRRILGVLDRFLEDRKLPEAQSAIRLIAALNESPNPLTLARSEKLCKRNPLEVVRAAADYYGFKGLGKYFSSAFWRARGGFRRLTKRYREHSKKTENGPLKTFLTYIDEEHAKRFLASFRRGELALDEIERLRSSCDQDFEKLLLLDKDIEGLNQAETEFYKALSEASENSGGKSDADWSRVLITAVHEDWENGMSQREPVVSEILAGDVDHVREMFKEDLGQKFSQTAKWLTKRLKSNFSTFNRNNRKVITRLNNQVNKKRNRPSIRMLNDELLDKGYHQATVPCWLVSPETVSDIFPTIKGLFDLVIFDEASQCPVENALPSIYRGKKVVIAGDEKQLPPLDIFKSSDDVGEEEEKQFEALDSPSILNLAKSMAEYEFEKLEWHYRAEFEELINFSNHAFYHGMIRISPNTRTYLGSDTPPIEWLQVEGYWESRANEVEAKRVVVLIREALSNHDKPTVGVITFNTNQRDLIRDVIDQTASEDEEFRALIIENEELPTDQQVFVKNIENVQGDERELIIFSIGYAPDHPGGRVKQHFGSLNNLGGENRLNVAVSRAIKKIIVVASIHPSDLDVTQSQHDGPKLLKRYLEYAYAVGNNDLDRVRTILSDLSADIKVRKDLGALKFDSPFEEEVYEELTSRGYTVHPQVGQSGFKIDLAVVDPNDPSRYAVGIECDGAKFHSSITARERDVFRQKFLERRKWHIHRIWSTKWWHDRGRELKKLEILISGKEPDRL